MLLRQIIKNVDHPTEKDANGDPKQFTIRRLNRKQQKKAREARQVAALTKVVALGGSEALKKLQTIDADPETRKEAEAEAAKDPFGTYDQDAVLLAGVVGWPYLEDDDKTSVPVTADTLDLLDDDTAEWLAKAIIAFFKGEDDAKNDSSPSAGV